MSLGRARTRRETVKMSNFSLGRTGSRPTRRELVMMNYLG